MEPRSGSLDRPRCFASIVGFSGLTAGLVAAHANPATEYELSIYAGTPAAFWVGVSVAFLAALVLSFTASNGRYRLGGMVLGGLASTAVVSLSILRGYFFHGVHDPLTHAGYAREIANGTTMPADLLYPGVHTLGAFVSGATGYSVWRSMMLVTVVVVLVFYVSVPLVVGAIVDGDLATPVGAFSAFLLLPVHLVVGNSVHVHPSSQTIMIAPLALFLLVVYLRSPGTGGRFGVLTSAGLLLLLVTSAAILYHPQQALNLVTLLVAIGAIQFVARRRGRILPRRSHRPVYSVAGVSVVLYLVWVVTYPGIVETGAGAVAATLSYFGGAPTTPGSAVGSQSGALRAIGVSLPLFYLKVFAVSTVYLVVSGLVLVAAFANRLGRTDSAVDATRLIRYLGVGLLVALPVFGLYFLGNVGVYYFRQAGFMLMIVTVLGAVGIAHSTEALSKRRLGTGVRLAVIGGFAVMLVLSSLVVYNSPHVHRANQHVTEARVGGYDLAFRTTPDDAFVAGVRQDPNRYYEALVDTSGSARLDGTVNSSQLHRLTERRDDDWYLMLSRNTYEREIIAYREYRFSRSDLAAVDRQVGVNRVHANGDTELYYVRGD